MLGIKGMVVGGRYLAGDSLGYDIVVCLETNVIKDVPPGCYGVKVQYEEDGHTDVWFECPDSGFSIYVEPR